MLLGRGSDLRNKTQKIGADDLNDTIDDAIPIGGDHRLHHYGLDGQ